MQLQFVPVGIGELAKGLGVASPGPEQYGLGHRGSLARSSLLASISISSYDTNRYPNSSVNSGIDRCHNNWQHNGPRNVNRRTGCPGVSVRPRPVHSGGLPPGLDRDVIHETLLAGASMTVAESRNEMIWLMPLAVTVNTT